MTITATSASPSSAMTAGAASPTAWRSTIHHRATGVLDVIPTGEAWARADDRFAVAYWPWSLLARPEPLSERILMSDADAIVDHALDQWGSHAGTTHRPALSV